MKFTISQKDFNGALKTVFPMISQKSTLPMIMGVHVKVDEGAMELRATDAFSSAFTRVTCEVQEAGEVVVPAQQLSKWVAAKSDGDIKAVVGDGRIKLKSGKSSSSIPVMIGGEFPTVPDSIPDGRFVVDLTRFANALECALTSTPKDADGMKVFSYVGFEMGGETLTLVGMDGYRLSKYSFPLTSEIPNGVVLVSNIAIANILKAIKGEVGDLSISVLDNKIIFGIKDTVISSLLHSGDMPDYRTLFFDSYSTSVLINVENLRDALARSRIFALRGTDYTSINVEINKDGTTITARDQELGESTEVLESELNGEEIAFGIRTEYFADTLKSIITEKVVIEKNGERSAIFVRNNIDGDGMLHLVMPMVIS